MVKKVTSTVMSNCLVQQLRERVWIDKCCLQWYSSNWNSNRYWNDSLPLSEIFPVCFIYLLIYWHQWQFLAFAIFQPNSSIMASQLCDRRVNAHLHFLPWAGSKLQTPLSYMNGISNTSDILPLPAQQLSQCCIIQLGDRGTCVWTTCPGLLHDNRTARSQTHDPAIVSASIHAFNIVSTPKEKFWQVLNIFSIIFQNWNILKNENFG